MVKVLKVRRLGAGGQLAVSRDDLRFLGWEVGTRVLRLVERTPDGQPTHGLKSLQCDCGAKGSVAVKVACTNCGKETQWGFFGDDEA